MSAKLRERQSDELFSSLRFRERSWTESRGRPSALVDLAVSAAASAARRTPRDVAQDGGELVLLAQHVGQLIVLLSLLVHPFADDLLLGAHLLHEAVYALGQLDDRFVVAIAVNAL